MSAAGPLQVGDRITRMPDGRRFEMSFVNHRADVPVFTASSVDGAWGDWGGPMSHLRYGDTFVMTDSFNVGKPCEAAGPNHPDNANKLCRYEEPHDHGGFDCDLTCPCRTAQVDGSAQKGNEHG